MIADAARGRLVVTDIDNRALRIVKLVAAAAMWRAAAVLYLNKGQLKVPRCCEIACRRTISRLNILWLHFWCAVVTRG